ncbi:MAG: CHRD domain-containing protein [Mesorhizobium sp.]|uniref:CHRD domain-containing protein n=1 Tax=unclassified Mesorhizobium TaxID=325217 RepID=UPI000F74F4D9|nr:MULTISPECIES: CHRD domain-containing protein [unclassified Mesorhizobium]RVD73729.1 CHRD domain-containing protein [Mesorhizobium sp. M4A.F.Ca.ET.029.04.2.1]AZO46363.1 CHRD domain-containing protein [Mesorhizobium sp. M4B.F.Ca.ET.058.02.1.1]RVC43075.1 CHRD domain-containing protein [Mesorhizobium sp. M4A.F.Ca.ET.090.04.2.1]RVC79417.1 CHRD domain-containing protein [Mesorhizobium sp. M4A.F.Ca.ET.022.05.2.1]RVD38919.1 CHRD domain-containing protein [Mesorhizobium sp. M4A.F.Ca.ET.020.02.1.1]
MRIQPLTPMFSALAISASILLAFPALAETVKYTATLDGGQQSPPVTTKGKGTATFTFDTAKKKLSWNVKYSGLSGPATAAHIHGPAAMGANAGPVIPFKKLKSPIKGSATLTDAQAADLEAGKYYVNVHTAANKDGEIRGQIEKAM